MYSIFLINKLVLLSIRNAKEKPDSPSQALLDYFGSYKNDSWKEFNSLEE
jgi:hypothetical protein